MTTIAVPQATPAKPVIPLLMTVKKDRISVRVALKPAMTAINAQLQNAHAQITKPSVVIVINPSKAPVLLVKMTAQKETPA